LEVLVFCSGNQSTRTTCIFEITSIHGTDTISRVQGPVSQKVINRTISDLSYEHLPTKFPTVSQN
jgi:hypothetical protein